ncbi:4'-phosphopantetheinyl transferase family protein [Psychromonas arctica]|uniref:4'-phosphopantetheinyl transferase family protein n=1 Tax=Psychromonas arctica TaxID=168275 RepID=UPI002FD2DE67
MKCANNILIDNPTCIDADSVSIQRKGHLIIASCTFSSARFNDKHFNMLDIAFPSMLNKAVAKRKSEFLAGRYLAKIIMKHLQFQDKNIGINEHKAPVWPQELLGSITHSRETAHCVITKLQSHKYIGIDVEHWLSTEDANSLMNNIVSDQNEYQILLPYINFEQAITLIFSAKESLYKAIFKEFEHYVDFHVAKVTKVNFNTRLLTLTLCQDLSKKMYSGREFICQFNFCKQSVTTLISD